MRIFELTSTRLMLAYLDPGSGSYLLQLLIGALLGALFLLRAYWGRVKAFFSRTVLRSKPEGEEKPE